MKLLVPVFLLFSLFLRILLFSDYPLENDEMNRDYLIAHHIISNGEFPVIGPINGIYEPVRNSPLTYYVIAAILRIRDDIGFLRLANILLQTGVLFLLYLTAKRLFDGTTAGIALLLFGLSFEGIGNAASVWQPHLMIPFFAASLYLTVVAWQTNRPLFWAAALTALTLAGALHMSAFSFLPLFFVLAARRTGPSGSIRLLGLLGLLVVLLYGSSWVVLSAGEEKIWKSIRDLLVSNISAYLGNVVRTLLILADRLFFFREIPLSIVFAALLIGMASAQRRRCLILILAIASPVVAVSFFEVTVKPFWLTPCYLLFALLTAASIRHSFAHSRWAVVAGMLLTFSYLTIFSRMYFYRPASLFTDAPREQNKKTIHEAQTSLTVTIDSIRKREGYREPDFFDIVYYQRGSDLPRNDAAWWILLEQAYRRPFVRIVPTGSGYVTTNGNIYMFLICLNSMAVRDQSDWCLEPFGRQYPEYRQRLLVTERPPLTIYLTHR